MGAAASHAARSSTSAAAILTQQKVGCSPLSAWLDTYAGAASKPECNAQPASHGTCIRRILQLFKAASCGAVHVFSVELHVVVQLSPSCPITASTPSSSVGRGNSGMTGFPAITNCHHQGPAHTHTCTQVKRRQPPLSQPQGISNESGRRESHIFILSRTERRKAVFVPCQVGILIDRAVRAGPTLSSAILKGRAPLACLRPARPTQVRQATGLRKYRPPQIWRVVVTNHAVMTSSVSPPHVYL